MDEAWGAQVVRDWALITGMGGGSYKTGVGASEVVQKGRGAKRVLAMLNGEGDTNSFGEVLTWELEVLAVLKGVGGGRKSFRPLKVGVGKSFTLS